MVRPKSISERGRELALETSPGARALLAQVMADPSAPLAVAVVGPGGTGKSAVLDAVEDAYRGAGVDVVRLDARRRQLPSLDAAVVVLVDGAHRLEPAVLDELHALADSPDARVVVAYRPWPRSRGLSELVASLSRRRAPVVVGHLSRSAVKSRVAARLGSTPPDELVELVLEQSGGLPAFGRSRHPGDGGHRQVRPCAPGPFSTSGPDQSVGQFRRAAQATGRGPRSRRARPPGGDGGRCGPRCRHALRAARDRSGRPGRCGRSRTGGRAADRRRRVDTAHSEPRTAVDARAAQQDDAAAPGRAPARPRVPSSPPVASSWALVRPAAALPRCWRRLPTRLSRSPRPWLRTCSPPRSRRAPTAGS